MKYPDNPEMEFGCSCPVQERKNVWNNIAGYHMRYCPYCHERRIQYYEPVEVWENTGRGRAGEPEPKHIVVARTKASLKKGRVENPQVP